MSSWAASAMAAGAGREPACTVGIGPVRGAVHGAQIRLLDGAHLQVGREHVAGGCGACLSP
jgi:hypothetical protein